MLTELSRGGIMLAFLTNLESIMEAEYTNRIENNLSDLAARAAQLRRYL